MKTLLTNLRNELRTKANAAKDAHNLHKRKCFDKGRLCGQSYAFHYAANQVQRLIDDLNGIPR